MGAAVVAGCSMGGNVAQAFAAEFPHARRRSVSSTPRHGTAPDAAAKFKERGRTAAGRKVLRKPDRLSADALVLRRLRRQSSGGARREPQNIFAANDVECYAGVMRSAWRLPTATRAASRLFKMPTRSSSAERITRRPVAMRRQLMTRFRSRP
jgi:pimeloyl-ACP methyl ester carboxylesterase